MEPLLYERNSAFDHSLWHRFEYLSLLSISNALQTQHEAGYEQIGYSVVQDAYYALKNSDPNLSSKVGKAWGEVMKQDFFPQLQDMMRDRDSKINTVLFLAEKFYQHYMKEDKKNPTPQQQTHPNTDLGNVDKKPTSYEENLYDAQREKEDQEENEEQGDHRDDTPPEITDALNEIQEQAQDGEGNTESSDEAGPQFGAIVVKKTVPLSISQEEIDDLQDKNETFIAMGGLQSGTEGSVREIREFTEEMFKRRKLTRLADLIGWAERIVGGAKRENQGAVGEFTKYGFDTLTRNVHHADRLQVLNKTPQGMSMLANRKLRTRRYDEKKPAGKGAVVFMPDESGSMTGVVPGTTTSKRDDVNNLQLAMGLTFKKENRPFVSIAWASYSTRTYEFGKPGLQDHLNEFLGGGTHIIHALWEAFRWLDENKEYDRNADILIVSDGWLADNPAANIPLMKRISKFQEKGGRIWFVLVGEDLTFVQKTTIERWANFAISFESFYDDEKMGEVLRLMARDNTKHESYLV